MALDRKGRDETTNVLLAYMRAEIMTYNFYERLLPLASRDKGLAYVREVLSEFPDDADDYHDHPIWASPEAWAWLLRVLAFLRTDLEFEVVYVHTDRRRRRLAAAGLVVIGVAAAISCATGLWGILEVVWLVVGAGWALWPPRQEPDNRLQELKRFWPFRSEQQWREHEPLLQGLDIPRYQPSARARPPYREGAFSAACRQGSAVFFIPVVLLLEIAEARRTLHLAKAKEPLPGGVDGPGHKEH
jgi:hypothetical protein